MKLRIDTTNEFSTTVTLFEGSKILEEVRVNRERRSQVVLEAISKALTSHHLTLTDITELEVAVGPGSFTGVRVGISVANTLQFLLGIPLNGKFQSAKPVYE